MPDWSYTPLLRPLLFRLPPELAREVTLGLMGRLAALPPGPAIIEFLGHMQPPPALARQAWGLHFPAPVGLAAGLDAVATALPALARFGLGFVEVGPVAAAAVPAAGRVRRLPRQEAIWYPDPPGYADAATVAARLARSHALPVPVGVRLAHQPGATAAAAAVERSGLVAQLAPFAAFFTLETRALEEQDGWSRQQWQEHLRAVLQAAQAGPGPRPLLVAVAPHLDDAALERILTPALELGAAGVVIGEGVPAGDGGWLVGPGARAPGLAMLRRLRERYGRDLPVVGAGGVHDPVDALRLLAAGATLVTVHSGLVYAGPGLPKRINAAVSWQQRTPPAPAAAGGRRASGWTAGWGWLALLGAGMILGGVLAWLVAATRVVLPYDEAFVGLTRAELAAINPRLLPFMAHDRVTLAGTMIAIGVLYLALALQPLRRGAHWARQTLLASGTVGFSSFLLFLGFGYFDPLHAAVTLLLLPFFLLGIRGLRRGPAAAPEPDPPDLVRDRRWLAAQWGQLLLVITGAGLTAAGLAIAAIGVTSVFVPSDLAFLQTTPEALHRANPRLVPLVAHDRAGFGGALVANGLAVLLTALWGFRPGARWLWWGLLAAGVPGFAGALGVHVAVGYVDGWHLAPAVAGAAIFLAGMALAYPYLMRRDHGVAAETADQV